jgi:hypothetical protein
VHVPLVTRLPVRRLGRPRFSLDDLALVSEAILRAAIPAARLQNLNVRL